MSYCSNCGAPLAENARFCSRCGTAAEASHPTAPAGGATTSAAAAPKPEAKPVAPGGQPVPVVIPPPPPRTHTATSAPKKQRSGKGRWWIGPAVLVGLVLIAFLVLAGFPFGRDEDSVSDLNQVETVTEGTAPAPSTPTIVEVAPTDDSFAITETSQPPLATGTAGTPGVGMLPPGATSTYPAAEAPAPVPDREPVPRVEIPAPSRPAPRPATPATSRPAPTPARPATTTRPATTPPPAEPRAPAQPAPQTPAASEGIISASEASSVLRGAVAGRYSGVSAECTQIRSEGYRNVGYTFSVWDTCLSGGGSRMLGRWRVDAKTREVFRQRENGRYLSP